MRRIAVSVLLFGLGCTPDDSGASCDAWSLLDPTQSHCVPRDWSSPSDPMGEPGAQKIEAALDSEGRGLLAWVSTATNHVDTEATLAEERSDGWTLRAPGESLPGFGAQPTVATGPGGRALFTWKQQLVDAGTVFAIARSEDGRWSRPDPDRPLSFPPTAYEPRPVLTEGGESLVVWNQFGSTGFGVAVARGSGSRATDVPMIRPRGPDDVLSPPINFSNAPQIAVNAHGDAIVTWYQSNGGPLAVYVSERWGHQGSFSRPGPDDFISHDAAPVDSHPIANPTPAIDDDGEVTVVWTQENSKGDVLVYLATRDPDGAWDVPSGPDDTFGPALGRAACARPMYGADGALWVVWYQDLGAGYQVFAAHRDPDGVWIERGERGEQGVPLSSVDSIGLDPTLIVAPDGSALAVWTERSTTGAWRIASRRRGPGDERWGALEFLSEDDGRDATQPALAIDGRGRILAAWVQGPPQATRVHVSTLEDPPFE